MAPALAAGLAVVGAALAGWQLFHVRPLEDALTVPFRSHRGEVLFRVGRGSTARSVAERLEASGIIASRRVFLYGVGAERLGSSLQAGLYRFDAPVSPAEVIRRITGGEVATRRITVPEGLDLEQTAALLEELGVAGASSLRAVFSDPELTAHLIGDLDPEARDLEGYLFPSTYDLPADAGPRLVAALFSGTFRRILTPNRLRSARERERSLREIATLASIVEKETGDPAERPRVASVFWNRLRVGMLLQSDPTVLFAMRREGDFGNNIRRRDLKIQSPYNTYVAGGLPPGPIASFGTAALDAVLDPEETGFFYFVSRNDGTHVFSRSLAEHNRAVRRWQVLPFRR